LLRRRSTCAVRVEVNAAWWTVVAQLSSLGSHKGTLLQTWTHASGGETGMHLPSRMAALECVGGLTVGGVQTVCWRTEVTQVMPISKSVARQI
jgi:hypothetical protein